MSTTELPFVSVVVPALNCADDVEGFAASLRAQTYPADRFETIVVDNGSSDGTFERTQQAGLIALRRAERGRARALNTGISAARGEFVLTTDLSCRPESGWIARVVATFAAYPRVACVAGEIKMLRTVDGAVIDFQQRANYMSPMLALNRTQLPFLPFADGANASFRRSLFDEIGGFEESFVKGADVEICYRMFVLTRHAIAFDRQAVVWEPGEPSLRALLHQRFRMGIGANLMRMKFPALYAASAPRRSLRQRYWAARAAVVGGLQLLRLNALALVGKDRAAAADADIRLMMTVAQRIGRVHGRRWLRREGVRPTPIDEVPLRDFLARAEGFGERVIRVG
jgi:cellulose synthase/poly-beta-1,6-N-acetylglucosamine synthase-like glycosyltransferase